MPQLTIQSSGPHYNREHVILNPAGLVSARLYRVTDAQAEAVRALLDGSRSPDERVRDALSGLVRECEAAGWPKTSAHMAAPIDRNLMTAAVEHREVPREERAPAPTRDPRDGVPRSRRQIDFRSSAPRPRGPRDPERDARIVEMRRSGVPLEQIAAQFGVSVSRIVQIASAAGVLPGPRTRARGPRRKVDYMAWMDGRGCVPSIDEIVEGLGVSRPTAYAWRDEWALARGVEVKKRRYGRHRSRR